MPPGPVGNAQNQLRAGGLTLGVSEPAVPSLVLRIPVTSQCRCGSMGGVYRGKDKFVDSFANTRMTSAITQHCYYFSFTLNP